MILDAECAVYGDPAFDLAFVVNHLLLKGIWHPSRRDAYTAMARALIDAYRGHVGWEAWPVLDARTAALLPGLLLARVDGKSPAEYVTQDQDRDAIRSFACAHLDAASRDAGTTPACLDTMTPTTINRVHARRIWDSRGRPTVEAEVRLAGGAIGRGIAPAGASRGSREAIDLRDGGSRSGGYDVNEAVANVRGPIARAIFGMDALDQADIDQKLIELDGTPNMARLGGNATVAVSLAVAHAAALRARPAAVAAPGRRQSGLAAAARGADLRRRRACGSAHRHPGPDGDAGGRLDLRRRTRPCAPRSTARPAN